MGKTDELPAGSGGPTFDGWEPQETDTERTEVWQLLEETKRDAERAGIWLLLPSRALIERGEIYYNIRVDKVREAMAATGATPEVVDVVCKDYAGILFGHFKFEATPQQMQQALRSLKPYVAFSIDRYVLYFGLLTNYSRYLLRYADYTDNVKGVFATEETKRAYISGFYPALDACAVRWLLSIGYIQPSDFAGFDPADMNEFFARIAGMSAIGEYTAYYTIARLALTATPQELAEVEPPPVVDAIGIPITKFCEQVLQETAEKIDKAGVKFASASANTSTEKQQSEQAGKDWHDDTNTQPVKIHENYGIVLSRPVNVSPHGKQITDTKSVREYIESFKANPQAYTNLSISGNITEMTVQKVFEGVNLLPQYLSGSMKLIDNGRYEFDVNISEFAEMCGYTDANQEEKSALLGALILLSNLYFVLDKPKKYAERINAKGKKVRYYTGGRVAVQFLNVPRIGVETGDLKIEVYPESLKGRPTLLTPETYKQLRAEAKGLTQSRFNAQIATKSHKSERDLIDEVFGFADMLKYATPEDLPKVTKYVQGHRSRERDRILSWFTQYVKAGILTEFKREPSKTDKRDYILSWVCPDPSKLDPPPFVPDILQADEQTQPNG